MANDLTVNPIIIDTAGASVLITSTLNITAIRWVSKTAGGGDDLVVQDKNGNVLFETVATGENYAEAQGFDSNDPLQVNGLIVPTIDSGTLYLYSREQPPYS